MNPLRDCHLRTHQMLRGHTKIFARAYHLQPNNVSHAAVERTMCHAGIESASFTPSTEPQWELTLTELLPPYRLGSGRRSRSDWRKLKIPSTSCALAARGREPSTNLLAGLDAPFASARLGKMTSYVNKWSPLDGAQK